MNITSQVSTVFARTEISLSPSLKKNGVKSELNLTNVFSVFNTGYDVPYHV